MLITTMMLVSQVKGCSSYLLFWSFSVLCDVCEEPVPTETSGGCTFQSELR